MTPVLAVTRYSQLDQSAWNNFVSLSRNGTFLFHREYMDYHADQFRDHSLVVRRDDHILALLPGNEVRQAWHSHQGLSYGGVVVGERMTAGLMLETLSSVIAYLKQEGFTNLSYKTIPHIYHRQPAEEDRYALHKLGAKLTRRDGLSVVAPGDRGRVQKRRQRGNRKAIERGFLVGQSPRWEEFWEVLSQRLERQHQTAPVHTASEIERLARRFPHNIKLFVCLEGDHIVGGTVIYETDRVAHAQYIAASPEGADGGALDLVFEHLIKNVYSAKQFVDFGSSRDPETGDFNEGLVEQKEGFGARTIVHDFYELSVA